MSALHDLLDTYRNAAVTEREKGTYFEELICAYFRNEAKYKDDYEKVWTYAEWAREQGMDARDTGIDLVARTRGTSEFHAIQCKLYAEDYKLQKADIDSFFTASGKKPFVHRIIVCTTNLWSDHAEEALVDQRPPVSKIDLFALESSQIDWAKFKALQKVELRAKKKLLDHQDSAVRAVLDGLSKADRGKMIMACGTGKTFTSLKIAEQEAGKGKRVLFLVPSLALLSQTLTEWTQESETPLHSFAVCSDSDVGKKKRRKEDDEVQTFVHELRFPATTDARRLAQVMKVRHDDEHMSVVFSTYQSIDVIHDAQHNHDLEAFDLIVCDEAHRTTGYTYADEDESHFVKVHDADYIRGAKRLYMTATPKIYSPQAEAEAERDGVEIYGMNKEEWFGKQLFLITFSDAVKRGLLVDYKVLVLAVEESYVNRKLQALLAGDDNQIKVDDAAKIIGCWKALAKQGLTDDLLDDHEPMKRAVAFCQVIDIAKGAKTHKVSSKNIAGMFKAVVDAYQEAEDIDSDSWLTCDAQHVDGGMNASIKEEKLQWLKAPVEDGTCRVLSNVRCLSEGVDVPALDAVLFLTPRNSQVDVVQSVGRVMRNAPGKKRGYVILPVVIPADVEPDQALNDNKTYAVVWQVLQALRSHDDRFDTMINKLDLVGHDTKKMEVIAVTDKVQRKVANASVGKSNRAAGRGQFGIGSPEPKYGEKPDQGQLAFEIGIIEKAIYAKIVQKCGDRHYWEKWVKDIDKIARTHISRIREIVANPNNTSERAAFDAFAAELRDDLNDSITDEEVIEMLAQHLITKPVFDALFAGYSFAQHNPMSQAMQGVLNALNEHRLDKEADTLEEFYESVRERASGLKTAEGKQKIVVELYDKFFANAFPKLRDKLGIVYTPVEVVDFIIHSVAHLLQAEFGQSLGDKNVHILDPFTGTGTFITRLLQSGLISREQLPYKYKSEIHANEIVLLAYYIAAINIEEAYHDLVGGEYEPFEGICLTDTFQMYEKEDLVDQILVDNSSRRKRQRSLDIRVILGNPPYAVGQDDANENNKNLEYKHLDQRIAETYAARSNATLSRNLYDSYIRAIRWATDRLGDSGVIGFVTNGGFLDANGTDGLRKTLAEEFSSIHVFHLRGNQRTLGELSRREGGKIFAGGSRAPIAITLLVKNPAAKEHGLIRFHDIGDYLSREEKLQKIDDFKSIVGIDKAGGWVHITPNQHGDWLRQRDDRFAQFIAIGDKKGDGPRLFENYSLGVFTSRDSWCYNASRGTLEANMRSMIAFYNEEVGRFSEAYGNADRKTRAANVDGFVGADATKISWSRGLKQELLKGKTYQFQADDVIQGIYRPFNKQWFYFNRRFNEMVLQMPRLLPDASASNRLIVIHGPGETLPFTVSMVDVVPNLHYLHGGQCFPLYLYDGVDGEAESPEGLFSGEDKKPAGRRDAITDDGLAHFQSAYPGEEISKEDIFYYVYGLFHVPDYRERYADNLSKELARIPCVKQASDFWLLSRAGRDLADLHINYDRASPYAAQIDTGGRVLSDEDYRVVKMKVPKKGKEKDLSTLIYNNFITVRGIPAEAYDYVVNGKPALVWVTERQCKELDKASGIVDDANDWAIETMKNPRYPLDLFLRVITVSLETIKIVRGLPKLHV
ncbi:DEAD/DEAH box helicase [Dyella telluris]|uniref:DEAD/DEAH box helicase n=1 Tax=Dyella telluris TaxID=2763498 RepID=A0A7G8Q411_9GAMM|nr:type ISP restriction/modification enzyme [Dyella telluris]QNK01519.1 DEAD/DEAH box helicase [Dyella telluris]